MSLATVFLLIASLTTHDTYAASWRLDGNAALVDNSNGDVLQVVCVNGPRVVLVMDGIARSSATTVEYIFDGREGFRGDWKSDSALGIVRLWADGAMAWQFIDSARPAGRVSFRTARGRASFTLSGFTAVTRRLPCIGR